MAEQKSIRDEFADWFDEVHEESEGGCYTRGPDLADMFLASPVIRRIQADAIWEVRMKLNEHLLQRHGASHVDYALELLHNEATRLRSE